MCLIEVTVIIVYLGVKLCNLVICAQVLHGGEVVSDVGIVESITLKNFMCHSLLGPFAFGSNVNFVVGNNGSEYKRCEALLCLPYLQVSTVSRDLLCYLCINCFFDRWKECHSDCSHSCFGGECTSHKQRIIPQGFCEGRREVNSHLIYLVVDSL